MLKLKTVKIPIYFGSITIVITDNWAEVKSKWKNLDVDNCYAGAAWDSDNSDYLVVFLNRPTAKVIAHEAVHLVNFIFKGRGVKLDLDNDEPQAYLTGWVFEQIEKFLNKVQGF